MKSFVYIGLFFALFPLAPAAVCADFSTGNDGGQPAFHGVSVKPSFRNFAQMNQTFPVNAYAVIPSADEPEYPINFDKDALISRSDRYTNSVGFGSPTDGNQTIQVGQQTSKALYHNLVGRTFFARAGETVRATAAYTPGTWMHTYIYIDKGTDGRFDVNLSNGLPTAESDLVAFSCLNEKNSKGESVSPGNAVAPPAFTLPEEMAPGYYIMRYKVDWNHSDPGGNSNEGNTIVSNGGIIVDVRLNVHGEEITVSGVEGPGGTLLTEEGKELTTIDHPFGKPLAIEVRPASHFKLSHIRVRHGYDLDGDSLVRHIPQYMDEVYPYFLFQDGKLTLPAEVMDGEVAIEPYFVADSTEPDASAGDYALHFDKNTAAVRTDLTLNSATFRGTKGGTTRISLNNAAKEKVYADLSPKEVSVVPGDNVDVTLNRTGNGLHAYLYIDFDQDGQFSATLQGNGVPTSFGELVSHSYYNGYNSHGESFADEATGAAGNALPSFTIPQSLPTGVYRARLKMDRNNIDPAGQWNAGHAEECIDALGGQVVDFLLNVHNPTHKLTVHTRNGSLNGPGTNGLPAEVTCFSSLSVTPSPVAPGYVADSVTIRHGHHLDGPQYIRGNRQWSEYKRKSASTIALHKDSVNGEVVISAEFVPDGTETYKLVFSDEFEGDGMPDAGKWSRCSRQSPTWKRFMSKTEEEHQLTGYLEDGAFVARCLPNPFKATDNVDMISGGIESSGKFSFLYGKVEARIFNKPHTGNFPAFWMMPQDSHEGWPYCGEIDIWEAIDESSVSYHTIHSKWANGKGDGSECQGQSQNPRKGGTGTAPGNNWHTFGFEWEEGLLTWYVDGKKVFSYAKSQNQSDLDLGQWPFDKAFYLILNQSVGNGSWARPYDGTHTYETRFDWVRVYQKPEEGTGIHDIRQSETVSVTASSRTIHLAIPETTLVVIADMSGRIVCKESMQGNRIIAVQPGIYLVNKKKVYVP